MKAYVYMMTNLSRVVLYTGVTNDLERRVWEHQHAEVKGFTKRYRVNRLVYHEIYKADRRCHHARKRDQKAGVVVRRTRWWKR